MKLTYTLLFACCFGLIACNETGPTFQDQIEKAVSSKFPNDSIDEVVLIDTVFVSELEEIKSDLDGAIVTNAKLSTEMKERYERIFDLDIEMQLSYGAEKKQFKLLMEAEEAKMDNYTYSIDQLDSLSEIHNQDLTFVNNALMTHTIDERIAYYHVSALVNNEIKYLAISPVTSQFWEPLGAFDMPVLTH